MGNEPTISLQCVRENGRREITKLPTHALYEARKLAKRLLRIGNGLYTEVDICSEDGTLETIQNSAVPIHPSEVLLVEDNAGDALLIEQALVECSTPVHLRIARDGEQALQILGEPGFTPDLVILDLNIPRISGYAVLASYQLHETPVVVFSASQNEADIDRVLSLGAKDFVRKPLNRDDYKTAVTSIVQRWAGGNSADMESLPA